MDEITLKQTVARNIVRYRKSAAMTQAELAQQLHYSDKSVSKWERAEGLPDLYVMVQMADLFGVSVNDLLEDEPLPGEKLPMSRRRILTLLMAIVLSWLVGFLAFSGITTLLPGETRGWVSFLYAAVASCIILTVFSTLWRKKKMRLISVSLLIWAAAVACFYTSPLFANYYTYIVAGIVQVLAVLFFLWKDGLACLPFPIEKSQSKIT